jgi:hypothetical protein
MNSSKETLVLNTIKYFQTEYPQGVPKNILKIDLEISNDEINTIINELESKKLIKKEDSNILFLKTEDTKTLSDEPLKKNKPELTEREEKALEIIQKLKGDTELISRNILEGNLLYGDLCLSDIQLYNLLNLLDNKNILKRVQRKDGTYYSLNMNYKD